MSKRLLVTGSRKWTDFGLLHFGLMDAWKFLGGPLDEIILVSGNADGADKMAEDIWEVAGQPIERHPVEWRPHGIYNPQAGLARNREMVAAGADACVAFILDRSPGATHCAAIAEEAGIPTKRYIRWT